MTTHTFTTAEELAAPLLLDATGDRLATAAIELLINHAMWLNRRDFRRHINVNQDPDGTDFYARIDWHTVAAMLDNGELPCSSSEHAILRIALSIAGPHPVVLSDMLRRLDETNARHVGHAIARATRAH